jgi:type IV pilus assembly PilO-like protein
VTRSTKLLIPAIVAAAAAAAFWFMVLAPKREELTKLDAEITQQESAAAQAEQQAASYQQAKDNYRENYTTVARLGKAVPADDDVRSLLVQLDDTAKKSKVAFRALTVSGGGSGTSEESSTAASSELAPAPGAVPVGSAGFSAMPFTFTFSGSFFRLSDFFTRLERFVTVQNDNIDVTGRLLLVGSIAITPDGGDLDKLQAQVGASTYLVPPTQGVTAGASSAGPAGTTASADAGATTPPTATITGVR